MTAPFEPMYVVPVGLLDDLRERIDRAQKWQKKLEDDLAKERERTRFLGAAGPAEEAVAGPRPVVCYAVSRADGDVSDEAIVEATCPQWAADAYADARSLDMEAASLLVRRAATLATSTVTLRGRGGDFGEARDGAVCSTAPVRYRGDRGAHAARQAFRSSLLAIVVR